jgi:hypothetical protein
MSWFIELNVQFDKDLQEEFSLLIRRKSIVLLTENSVLLVAFT